MHAMQVMHACHGSAIWQVELMTLITVQQLSMCLHLPGSADDHMQQCSFSLHHSALQGRCPPLAGSMQQHQRPALATPD
jgi:hypothetical protein